MVSSFYAGGFSYHLLLAGGASTAIARPGTVLVELFSRQLSASHGACHPGCGHGAHVLWPGQSARIILKKMRCRKRRYQGQDDPYDPRIKGESGSLDHHGSCVDSFWNHDLLAKSSMMKLTLITLPACLLRLLPKTSQNIPKPTTIISIINHSPSKGFSKCATIVSPSHWLAQLTRKSPEKSLVAWGDAAGVGVPDAFQELWKPDGFWDRRIG